MVTALSTKRWLRTILLGMLVLVGIAVAVVFYFVLTFDIEAQRVKIRSMISQSLDREVRIDGKIALELSLWPRFVVEDISIANPSWATVPDLAKVERFEIQVALLPLLRKKLKILELNLIGADVHLERDEQGIPNWLMKGRNGGKPKLEVLPLVFAMHIKDSKVTQHVTERPPITLSIQEVEATLGMGEPFKIEGNTFFNNIPVGLSLHGGQLHRLQSQTSPWPIQGHILIDTLPIRLEGFISDFFQVRNIQLLLATQRGLGDRLESLFDRPVNEIGDVSVDLQATANKAGHHVRIVSKASKLDLSSFMSRKQLKLLSGVKFDSFEYTFESEGSTVDDIILNGRTSLSAKQGEVHWQSLNERQSKNLQIKSIEMQAEPRQAVKVRMQSSLESVQATLTLEYERIINLIWSEKPWPFKVHVQAAGVDVNMSASVHQSLQKRPIIGTVNAKISDLSQLGVLVGRKLQISAPASLRGKVEFTDNHLRVTDIRATLSKVAVRGQMGLRLEKPAKVSLNLFAKAFDVASLYPKHDPDSGISIKVNDIKLVVLGNGNTIVESILQARWELTAQTAYVRWRSPSKSTQYDIGNGTVIELTAQAGHMRWRSRTKPIPYSFYVSGFDISDFTLASDSDQPIRLSLKARYNDVAMELRGNLGKLSELINKDNPFPLELSLEAADMNAKFSGVFRKPLQDISVMGGLEIQTAQVTTLAKLLEQDWQYDHSLKVSGQLESRHGQIQLRDANLITTGVSMTGELIYAPEGSPRFDIHLRNNVVDLARYINQDDKTKSGVPAQTSTEKAQPVIPDVSLRRDLFDSLSTAIQVDDLKLMYETEHITTINAKLSSINGVFSLSPYEAHSPTGSSTQASLMLNAALMQPRVALSLSTNNLDYGEILKSMKISKNIVGKLDLKLDFNAQGLSLRELMGNANGTLEIVTDKGRIPRRALELWGGGLIRLLIPTTWFEKDVTDLNCAVGRFDINEGVMHSKMLLADTERITVAGETVLNLKTEQLAGLFEPKNKRAALVRLGTPIKVSGTLANIKAESAQSRFATVGKWVLGLSDPKALILLFGDLGSTEKNPCKALLQHPLPDG